MNVSFAVESFGEPKKDPLPSSDYADRDTPTDAPEPIQLPKNNTLEALTRPFGISTSPNDDTSDRSTETPHTKPRTLVEVDGIEPTTPCLQSRCSPS